MKTVTMFEADPATGETWATVTTHDEDGQLLSTTLE